METPKKLLKNKKEGESRWSRVSPFYTRPYSRGSADGVTTPREEPPGDGGRDGAAGLPVRGGRARTAGSRNPPQAARSGLPVPSCAARLCQQNFAAKRQGTATVSLKRVVIPGNYKAIKDDRVYFKRTNEPA